MIKKALETINPAIDYLKKCKALAEKRRTELEENVKQTKEMMLQDIKKAEKIESAKKYAAAACENIERLLPLLDVYNLPTLPSGNDCEYILRQGAVSVLKKIVELSRVPNYVKTGINEVEEAEKLNKKLISIFSTLIEKLDDLKKTKPERQKPIFRTIKRTCDEYLALMLPFDNYDSFKDIYKLIVELRRTAKLGA